MNVDKPSDIKQPDVGFPSSQQGDDGAGSGWAGFLQWAFVIALGWYLARLYATGQLRPFVSNLQTRGTYFWTGLVKLLEQEIRKRRAAAAAAKSPQLQGPRGKADARGVAMATGSNIGGRNSGQEAIDIELSEPGVSLSSSSLSTVQVVGLAPGETPLLSPAEFCELTRNLPSRCIGKAWRLAFSTSQHGYNLASLYNRARSYSGPTMLVVMASTGEVIGGFAPRDWNSGGQVSYFGSGESFVFRCKPRMQLYRWARRNDYFQLARKEVIALGGPHFALGLDASLDRGFTAPSDTYDNPPLVGSIAAAPSTTAPPVGASTTNFAEAETMFRAVRVELWAFVMPHTLSKSEREGATVVSASLAPLHQLPTSASSSSSLAPAVSPAAIPLSVAVGSDSPAASKGSAVSAGGSSFSISASASSSSVAPAVLGSPVHLGGGSSSSSGNGSAGSSSVGAASIISNNSGSSNWISSRAL